jgi:hypothetical protein
LASSILCLGVFEPEQRLINESILKLPLKYSPKIISIVIFFCNEVWYLYSESSHHESSSFNKDTNIPFSISLKHKQKTEISWPMFFFQLFKLIRNKKMAKNRRNFLPIDLSQQILPLNSNIFFSIEERGKKPQTRKQTFRSNSWLKLINFFLNFYFNNFNLVITSWFYTLKDVLIHRMVFLPLLVQ